MDNYSKKQKQEIRRLCQKLYKIELDNALKDLFNKFLNWKENKLDCFDLDDEIHLYKKNVAKNLYMKYSGNIYNDLLVINGIKNNLIKINDISENLRKKMI